MPSLRLIGTSAAIKVENSASFSGTVTCTEPVQDGDAIVLAIRQTFGSTYSLDLPAGDTSTVQNLANQGSGQWRWAYTLRQLFDSDGETTVAFSATPGGSNDYFGWAFILRGFSEDASFPSHSDTTSSHEDSTRPSTSSATVNVVTHAHTPVPQNTYTLSVFSSVVESFDYQPILTHTWNVDETVAQDSFTIVNPVSGELNDLLVGFQLDLGNAAANSASAAITSLGDSFGLDLFRANFLLTDDDFLPTATAWDTLSATASDDEPHLDIPVGVPVDVEAGGTSRDEGEAFVHDQHVHVLDVGTLVPFLPPPDLDGQKGITGTTGPTGIEGPHGIDGKVGTTGPTGATGPQGVTGSQGEEGMDGPSGPPGQGQGSIVFGLFTGP